VDGASARPVVAAFDFDGTITRRDSLKPFLVRAFGLRRVALVFMALAPLALRVALGRASVDEFKVRAIERLFAGAAATALRALGRVHARWLRTRMRPQALARIRWHRAQGHALVLVSASIDVYLEPVAHELGFDHLLCTRPSTRGEGGDERFDGGLAGEDCAGAGKVRALLALLGERAGFELHVYGNGPGDRELLAIADHPHFRAFP
jgi:phosphatidylglycerophosphatase C